MTFKTFSNKLIVFKVTDNHMVRKWFLIAVVLTAVLLGFTYETLLSSGVNLYLHKKSRELQIPFSYSAQEFKPQSLIFYNPVVELQGGKITADALVLQYSINPFSLHVDLKIHLESPSIIIEKELSGFENIVEQFSRNSYISTSCQISCSHGALSIYPEKQEQIFFEFTHDCSNKDAKKSVHTGYYFFNLSEKDQASSLQVFFSAEDPANVSLKANLQKVNAAKLVEMAKTFLPELGSWDVRSGLLDGEFSFAIANAKFIQGKGELIVADLEGEETNFGINASIKKAIFRTNAETGHASLDLLENGFLTFSDGTPYASFNNFNGKIEISDADHLEITLRGIWEDEVKPLYTELNGSLQLNEFADLFLKITLDPFSALEEPSFIKVDAKRLGSNSAIAHIDLQKFGPKQFHFWQKAIEKLFPNTNPISYHRGTLNALLNVTINKDKIESLTVENVDASNVFFNIKQWEAAFGAENVTGRLAINFLNPNPKDTLNADIDITNGQASLIGISYDFWHFNHIQTHLSVRKGVVQKSSASVELAGLKGSAEVDSFSEKQILRFELEGKALDLKPFLPERLQVGIDRKMAQDHLMVSASLSKTPTGVGITGTFKVQNNEGAVFPIAFGFELERASAEFLYPQYYESAKNTLFALDELSLPYLHALLHLEERLLLKQAGIQGFVLNQGWFKAENVLLDKFVSPFLFQGNKFSLKGTSKIHGSFDHLGLAIHYNANSLILENESLCIEVEKIHANKALLPASHYFDFVSGRHFGELPMRKGSYFDKNSGLYYSDVNAQVLFEGKKIHVLDMEAFSNGLYFSGLIDIDCTKPGIGEFDLEIIINDLHGKFSQIQHFCSHFDKTFFFLTLPLEADVCLRNKGCRLNFCFNPNEYTLATEIEGSITDAALKFETSELTIQDLSMNFTYDSQKGILDFYDLHGNLLSGKPTSPDEYTLHSKRIFFSNFAENEAEFDISLEDQSQGLIRLAGHTFSELNENEQKEIVFSFDPTLTHFGEIYPKKITLALTDWKKIAKAKLDFSFHLTTFLNDVQKFVKAGFLSLPHFLKDIGNMNNVGGDCDVSLHYNSNDAAFNFLVEGNNVIFDQHHFKTVTLSGKTQDKIWTIDQLQLDQLAVSAEFTKIESFWKANFLGVRYGKSLLMGLEGGYEEGDDHVKARINLLEVNLAKLEDLPMLAEVVEQYAPQGILKGVGNFNLEFGKKPFRFDIDLEASLANAKIKNLQFKDVEHFTCHLASDKGITFYNLTTGITLDNEPLSFSMDSLDYNNLNDLFLITGLHFNVPAKQLPGFVDQLKESFPYLLSENLASIVCNAKKKDALVGTLNVQKNPQETNLQLHLADGQYVFADREHSLRSFALSSSIKDITFSTQYQFNKHAFYMSGKIEAENLSSGEIRLTDAMHSADPSLTPLLVHWRKEEEKGFYIEDAHGFFGGMKIALAENKSQASLLMLEGQITTLNGHFRHLLDEDLSEQLFKWQIGQGYTLRGTFTIAKENVKEKRPICFYGTLSGQDFTVKGYHFKYLQSQVIFGPQTTQVSAVSIKDPAGALYIDQIDIVKEGEKSRLIIPHLNIQELRPSLLAEAGKPYPTQKKPLVIRELHIHNLQGFLGNAKSFTGNGNLYFNNPVKKHLQNTIFAFPAEILTRIGLDLSVLTPVTGTINYEIHDGKVFLIKFKDIYSHSRLSRFYLPNSKTASFMDFDGNLHIQVKMKQHTLIFKLAELFTVTIQGNLTKPSYTLLRQKPLHRSEVIASSD